MIMEGHVFLSHTLSSNHTQNFQKYTSNEYFPNHTSLFNTMIILSKNNNNNNSTRGKIKYVQNVTIE